MAFPRSRESVSKVIRGDAAEEASLGLRPIKVEIRDLNISPMEVMIQHNVLSEVAAAGEAPGLSILRDTAETALSLLNIVSKAKFNDTLEPVTVEAEDYTQAISGVLCAVDNKPYRMEKQLGKDGATEDRAITLSEDEDHEENTNEPVVQSGKDSPARKVVVGSKVDSPAGQDSCPTKVVVKAKVDSLAGQDSCKVVVAPGSSPVQGDQGDGGAGKAGVKGDAAGEEGSTAGQSTASVSLQSGSKSHNKKRACPLCEYHGVHLGHHLACVHPDDAESDAERTRLVYKADEEQRRKEGSKTTLTNANERLYQCGLPNCSTIVSRMSQHLRCAHKLTDPGALSVARKAFKRISGKRPRDESVEESKQTKKCKTDSSRIKTLTQKAGSSGTKTAKPSSRPPSKLPKAKHLEVESQSGSEAESARIPYADDSDDSLQVSEEDDLGGALQPESGVKWAEFYRQLKERDASTRGHFVSTFFRYLTHVEGGCHSEEQALIQTRQVNIILDAIDPTGDDLNCLVRNDGLDFWDQFAGPRLKTKKAHREHAQSIYSQSGAVHHIYKEELVLPKRSLG